MRKINENPLLGSLSLEYTEIHRFEINKSIINDSRFYKAICISKQMDEVITLVPIKDGLFEININQEVVGNVEFIHLANLLIGYGSISNDYAFYITHLDEFDDWELHIIERHGIPQESLINYYFFLNHYGIFSEAINEFADVIQ